MKKRILSCILVLSLLLSLIPMTAVTAYADSSNMLLSIMETVASFGTDSETVDWLFDESTTVDTFSAIPAKEYKTYLSLGDSTTFGYGIGTLGDSTNDFIDTYGYGKAEENSWPYRLADYLGIDFVHMTDSGNTPWYLDLTEEGNNFAQLGIGLFRVQDILWLLGDDVTRDDFSMRYFDMTQSTGSSAKGKCFSIKTDDGQVLLHGEGAGTFSEEELLESVAKNVENADLVTVSLGGNDLYTYYSMRSTLQRYYSIEIESDWETLLDENPSLKKMVLALTPLLSDYFSEEGTTVETNDIEMLVDSLLFGYLSLYTRIDDVLDRIHEMNPDATVALVGMYNPYRDVYYDDEEDDRGEIAVGKIYALFTVSINRHYRELAEERANWCCYVDTSETEVIGAASGMNIATNDNLMSEMCGYMGVGMHQSVNGHIYQADQVFNALCYDGPTKEEEAVSKTLELREALGTDILNGLNKMAVLTEQRIQECRESVAQIDETIREQVNRRTEETKEVLEFFTGTVQTAKSICTNTGSFFRGFVTGFFQSR